ncbi:MFS transporter [Jidongwangia harbinensis]|uniref:MFS transporter n=1 Tax=Jidongwangia harbinensis TaxID=2878561 RepID=UPI001CD9B88F|nr:MFS transporter [Jidongwangia harbinensis]MCA2212432.1 MFS transporter [Jidongwangia harbinensis]
MRRNASIFVAISLLSGFGSTAMSLAAGIWILDLTGSVSLAGLAGLCLYLPTLAAPWLGGLADRLPRLRLVIAVDLLLAAALLTLLTVRSRDQAWLVFAVLLGTGIGHVLIDAGETALLPSALPPSALADVNGWRSSAQEGMKLIAPLAGAGLYAWHGGAAVAALSAAMPVAVAILYTRLRLSAAPAGPAPTGRPGVRAGLAVLWGVREIRTPVLVAAVAIGLSGFTVASVYARVTDGLGLPSTFLGVLGSAQGAGSIVAGLAVGRLVTRAGAATAAAAGAALFAAGCVAWCLPWWPAMIAGSLAVGVGLPWALVAAVSAVQAGTPDRLLGRVAATSTTVLFGPIALTSPLGAAAVHLGPRIPLAIAAGVGMMTAVAVRVGRSAEHNRGSRHGARV